MIPNTSSTQRMKSRDLPIYRLPEPFLYSQKPRPPTLTKNHPHLKAQKQNTYHPIPRRTRMHEHLDSSSHSWNHTRHNPRHDSHAECVIPPSQISKTNLIT
ncbi:hypothetical protein HBH70_074370 [Parastagonospora nodorum]|nr:hypothetical protein HBH50_235290 [Parastagonospora nodorum]KAH4079239.1 hypothetical protein HBH48_221250 [Parastagonospora nodorum]KAH5143252.1 hypothetical protein HBH70_074370 [Parastagonospora nodorum]KAH5243850.1 hypothetical protein HBI72_188900 [Parastagonospora nodorum]KAH5457731.1 hypothetical protein HBI30_063180 [Parastagonospora nodorum]